MTLWLKLLFRKIALVEFLCERSMRKHADIYRELAKR